MKCVSYNIQYGIGLDGGYDIGRIVGSLAGADVIALQEVTRNNPQNQGRDMVAELCAALPDYFSVFGPNFEADMGSHVKDGRAVDLRFQFGNMILSKTPVLASRNFLLPRRRSISHLNLQRGALEAMIDTELGPLRFYSTHLDHRSPDERLAQIRFLMERIYGYPLEGGVLSGVTELGFPEPPLPEGFVLMGDFNMLPGSVEYCEVTGHLDHEYGLPLVASKAVDAAAYLDAAPQTTWLDPERPADESRFKRIDYCFVAATLAARIRSSHVDQAAKGSDHQPVWLELG